MYPPNIKRIDIGSKKRCAVSLNRHLHCNMGTLVGKDKIIMIAKTSLDLAVFQVLFGMKRWM